MSSPELIAVGERIATARESKGLSVAELAGRLEVSEEKLQKAEAGECSEPMILAVVPAIRRELIVDVLWLWGHREAGAPCPANDVQLQEYASRTLRAAEILAKACEEIIKGVKDLRSASSYDEQASDAFRFSEKAFDASDDTASELFEAADKFAEYYQEKAEEERLPETAARMGLEVKALA